VDIRTLDHVRAGTPFALPSGSEAEWV
jgi:hypothetical protein